jgi:DNA topoisomerase-2
MIFYLADDTCLREDNDQIEPKWYMPVIPLVLINSTEGIGTGLILNVSPSLASSSIDDFLIM